MNKHELKQAIQDIESIERVFNFTFNLYSSTIKDRISTPILRLKSLLKEELEPTDEPNPK